MLEAFKWQIIWVCIPKTYHILRHSLHNAELQENANVLEFGLSWLMNFLLNVIFYEPLKPIKAHNDLSNNQHVSLIDCIIRD